MKHKWIDVLSCVTVSSSYCKSQGLQFTVHSSAWSVENTVNLDFSFLCDNVLFCFPFVKWWDVCGQSFSIKTGTHSSSLPPLAHSVTETWCWSRKNSIGLFADVLDRIYLDPPSKVDSISALRQFMNRCYLVNYFCTLLVNRAPNCTDPQNMRYQTLKLRLEAFHTVEILAIMANPKYLFCH